MGPRRFLFALGMVAATVGCELIVGVEERGFGPTSTAGGGAAAGTGGDTSSGTGGSTGGGGNGAGGGGGSGGEGASCSSYCALVHEDNPLTYWRLGDTTGTIARDATGHQDGTYTGSVLLGQESAIAGDNDGSVYLNGASYVVVGDFADFTDTALFSLEAWVKSEMPAGSPYLIAKFDGLTSAPTDGYSLSLAPSAVSFARYPNETIASSAAVPNDTWTHLVAIWDGNTQRLYIDGVEVSSALGSSIADTTANLILGCTSSNPASEGGCLEGYLDEVALYDKPLPETRIDAHYAAAIR